MRRFAALTVAAATATACGSDGTGPNEPVDRDPPVLSAAVTDLSRIVAIVPPGSVSGDELKGHAFLQVDGGGPVPVYAPVDMVLTSGTWVGASDDFGLEFEVNDRFRLRLAHITDPRSDIAALIPRSDPSSRYVSVGPVSLAAGELIGQTTGTAGVHRFDFGLYDMDVDVTGPNAARYRADGEWTKLNSVCPFTYASSALRGSYLGLLATIAGDRVSGAPCRGLGDVAVSGTLAGEWTLDSHAPDAIYGPRLALAADLAGNSVRIGGVAGSLTVVGAPNPASVTDGACYAGSGRFVSLTLAGGETLSVTAGDGPCLNGPPAGQPRIYRR